MRTAYDCAKEYMMIQTLDRCKTISDVYKYYAHLLYNEDLDDYIFDYNKTYNTMFRREDIEKYLVLA